MIKTDGITAFVTNEMDMIIMVMSVGAIIFAEGITDRIISSWNGVNDPLIQERLQGAIDCYAIKFFARFLFNVGVCKCPVALQKQFENFFPAAGYTELISL